MNENTTYIITIFVAPLFIAFAKCTFDYFINNPKKSKEHLEKFFAKVLIPIMQELEGKNFNDIDKDVMNKISKIYETNFHLIPLNMIAKHNDLEEQFEQHEIVDEKVYNSYYKYLKLTFKHTRKRLGYPTGGQVICFRSLSFPQKFVVCLLTFIYFMLCLYFALSNKESGYYVTVGIYSVLIFIYLVADEFFTIKRIKRRKEKMVSTDVSHKLPKESEQKN